MSSILVFYPGALGDLLLAAPVFAALKNARPNVRRHLIAGLPQAELLKTLGLVEEIRSYDDPFFLPLFSFSPLPAALRRWFGNFNQILFFQTGSLHPDLQSLPNVAAVNPRPRPHPPVHHAQFLYDSIRKFFGLSPSDVTEFSLQKPPSQEEKPFLLIHPGSGSAEKNWPLENFLEFAHRWQKRNRGRVGFLLGPAEEPLNQILKAHGNFEIWNSPSWPKLLEIFARTTLYFGNDSGISHLAGLLGKQGLVFFRATDPAIWRPLGKSLLPVRVE